MRAVRGTLPATRSTLPATRECGSSAFPLHPPVRRLLLCAPCVAPSPPPELGSFLLPASAECRNVLASGAKSIADPAGAEFNWFYKKRRQKQTNDLLQNP